MSKARVRISVTGASDRRISDGSTRPAAGPRAREGTRKGPVSRSRDHRPLLHRRSPSLRRTILPLGGSEDARYRDRQPVLFLTGPRGPFCGGDSSTAPFTLRTGRASTLLPLTRYTGCVAVSSSLDSEAVSSRIRSASSSFSARISSGEGPERRCSPIVSWTIRSHAELIPQNLPTAIANPRYNMTQTRTIARVIFTAPLGFRHLLISRIQFPIGSQPGNPEPSLAFTHFFLANPVPVWPLPRPISFLIVSKAIGSERRGASRAVFLIRSSPPARKYPHFRQSRAVWSLSLCAQRDRAAAEMQSPTSRCYLRDQPRGSRVGSFRKRWIPLLQMETTAETRIGQPRPSTARDPQRDRAGEGSTVSNSRCYGPAAASDSAAGRIDVNSSQYRQKVKWGKCRGLPRSTTRPRAAGRPGGCTSGERGRSALQSRRPVLSPRAPRPRAPA
jgi:hypothetical protein